MFATALQTTHPGTDRRQNLTRTPRARLAQTTQCIAHLLWLFLLILRHAASNSHSIAAIYYTTMLSKTQHAHIKYILMYHIICAILQIIPMTMHAVQETILLMMPPNQHYRKFAHPQLWSGRYWRRIRYNQRRCKGQPLFKFFMLLSQVNKRLHQIQLWNKSMIDFANTAMDAEPGTFVPSDSAQYGGGKGNTLNTLWDELKKTKTKTQLTTPNIFNPHSREWLSSYQINSCLTLLLHTKYKHAGHWLCTYGSQ